MSETKKHHYVPQCYLRQFACNEKASRINVFDKQRKKAFCDDIINIAEKRNFYRIEKEAFTLPPPDDDPLYYEKYFSKLIENEIPSILNQIVILYDMTVPEKEVLSYKLKEKLSVFLLIQLFRTPKARKAIMDMAVPEIQKVKGNLYDLIHNMCDFPSREAFLEKIINTDDMENIVKSISLKHCTSSEFIESHMDLLIKDHAWIIYENSLYKSFPFITSDNPVVMYNLNNKDMGLFTRNGLDVDSTAIFFPLTPRFLLTLYHKRNLIGKYSESYQDRFHSVDEGEFILKMNMIHFQQCERFCYSNLPLFE